jgi:hypothetical protein
MPQLLANVHQSFGVDLASGCRSILLRGESVGLSARRSGRSVDAIVAPTVIDELTNTIVQWIRLHASGLITTVGDMLLTLRSERQQKTVIVSEGFHELT